MRIRFALLLLFFSCMALNSQVCINEYLPKNINGILDEDNQFSDWIEIFNNSDQPVDISGYGLSDDRAVPSKWTLPVAVLPARRHILVFASGKNRRQMPMVFQTLIDVGEDWKYLVPSSDLGSSWHDDGFDDSSWQTGSSSFGYSDNDDSTQIINTALSVFIRKEFTVTDISDMGRLILTMDYDDGFVAYINGHEVARSNLGTVGEYTPFDRLAIYGHEAQMYNNGDPEYFEIINPASVLLEGINIIAIQVHNNVAGSSDLSAVPFLTIGRMGEGASDVSPWLSFPDYGALHANFRMDADSGNVYLYNAQTALVDSTAYLNMPADISYGRHGDGLQDWCWFGKPTPGGANISRGTELIAADSVFFSPEGGLHPGGTTVTFSTPHVNDSVYYTLDGSIPDAGDILYIAPVAISGTKVIRARVITYDRLPGPVSSRTYVTGLNHDLPIVCLVTEPFNLWDNLSGIYTFGPNPPTQMPYFEANYWQDWERPVHIELYDTDGLKQVDQDAGMKIFGGWSRATPQKSLALFARSDYGKGAFRYRFFRTKPLEKFESLVLRNSGNDNMGLQFHDCFMTGLAKDMDVDVQAYQPAAIYLNGTYWGLLNIREKVSDHFVAGNFSVDADSVNLLEYDGQIINGDNSEFFALRSFLDTKATLQNSADFGWVNERMDMDNFIQYQILNIYLNNRDWPGNNIKFWNTTAPGSKWRWISFDTDFGFGIWDVNDYQLNTLEFALEPNGPGWPNPPWSTLFLRRLVTNTGFRNNFINQFCDRLNQDFLPSRINSDLDSLKALYENEIVNTFNRWDDSYDDWLCNYGGWLDRINNHKIFGQNRPAYCFQHLQSVFQLGQKLNITLNVSDQSAGYVKLNSIIVKNYPFTGSYFNRIPIQMTAIPRPGYKFTGWVGTVNSVDPVITFDMASTGNFKANFMEATEEDFSVIINEINYCSAADRDTKDWIELYNNGHTTADLSGWLLVDSNVDSGYVFAPGTRMEPGSYLVVCRDLQDFRAHNGNVRNSVGDLEFKLSAEGEIVRLFDAGNNLIDAVNYGTLSPWPDNANGTGRTLELRNASLNNSVPESWFAMAKGGTPGIHNTADTAMVNKENTEMISTSLECFPNPFRDFTTISIEVTEPGYCRLEVLDLQGRIVKVLFEGILNTGSWWMDWNGDGDAKGIYTIRLISPTGLKTMKVVRL